MKTTKHNDDVFLAQWIDGQISDSEFKDLVGDKEFITYKKIVAGIGVYEQLQKPLDSTFEKIKEKISSKNNSRSNIKTINVYAKIALAAAAIIVLFFSLNTLINTHDIEYASNFGEQKTVVLLDGSEVILNAKSQLKYQAKDWKQARKVFLDGEAFFKVTKGKSFTVVTNNGTVTVLGTQFNIISNPGFFDVICYQGKVKVTSNDRTFIMTPNQSVRYNQGVFENKTLNLLHSNPTWMDGESSFRRVPLSQVIMALEKQFNITFDSSNIEASILFTGSFNNKNLNIALASVFETVNIKYTILDKKILLSQ